MAKYINKELFLSSMGLVGDETKYGNRDSEHSSRSYSTWMGYEIVDSVDDCEDEDAVRVVRCKDCHAWEEELFEGHPTGNGECRYCTMHTDGYFFCSSGERRNNG